MEYNFSFCNNVEWWNYSRHKEFLASVSFWQVRCFHEDKLCQAACSAHIVVYSLRIWGLALISKWGQGKISISVHYVAAWKRESRAEKEADRIWGMAESSQQLGPVWLSPGLAKVWCGGLKTSLCAAWIFWLVLLEPIHQIASKHPASWGTHMVKSKIARTESFQQ